MDSQILEKIKTLKNELDVPLGLCREAIEASQGDIEQARAWLRKRGAAMLAKKSAAETGQGTIDGYIHFNGRVAALVELRSQTDFVAKSEEFKKLAHELALQVATMKPLYVNSEAIPAEERQTKADGFKKEVADKPTEMQEKIALGKLEKWYGEVCLVDQPYFKDEKMRVRDLINETANKFGEKIEVRRFIRMALNE